ncbi:uncharacterized protein LOC117318735 [Pecten maximus]|uniref:uncharacterized protein LOC117318735 n=1 Tax=Pecten maximus TaxID=6579 RepID=UPI001458126C|nr:uncharacterized protein LOC117318735 [Pecten maximus]
MECLEVKGRRDKPSQQWSNDTDDDSTYADSTPKRESVRSTLANSCSVNKATTKVADGDFFSSEDDNKGRKSDRNRKRKASGEENTRKSFGGHANKQNDCYPDGSDDVCEKESVEKFTPRQESSTPLPYKSNTSAVCGGAMRETNDDDSPSEDENKKKKRARGKKGHGKKTVGQPKRRRADEQRKKSTEADDDLSSSEDDIKNKKRDSARQPPLGRTDEKRNYNTGDHASRDSSSSEEKKYFFNDESALQFEAYHGGIHFLPTFAKAHVDKVKPLHVAASLGLKRNVSYIMEAGWDLDEKDQSGQTPIQMAENQVLSGYMQRYKFPQESETFDFQPQGDNTHYQDGVLPIFMEKVDLSTRMVFLPSFQFRMTLQRGQHQQLLFTLPYTTTYTTVCLQQAFGVLWVLGQYGKDVFECLNHICLSDWSIQSFRDVSTGKLDVTAWLRNNERQQQHSQRQQQHTEIRAPDDWIQKIVTQQIESFISELKRGIELLDDGWTPMHYAILTRQHNLIKILLDNDRGNLETRTRTLLPRFILEKLKHRCRFEYDYVYRHTEGFTPLLLSTFLGDKEAIDIIGKRITESLGMGDCLTLAYGDDTEKNLLNILCRLGERHVQNKFNLKVKLHSVYEKHSPNRRVLIGSSDNIYRRIEEDFNPVRLVLDNENIVRETLEPTSKNVSTDETIFLNKLICLHADELWRRNSNLNAIVPGMPNDDSDNDDVMVVLHCSHKGFIHTGELPFKSCLNSDGKCVRVLVIQGFFRLGPFSSNTQSVASRPEAVKIQVGYKVKYMNDDMMATLGVMVEDDGGDIGILTCAHTFIGKDMEKPGFSRKIDELYDGTRPYTVEVFLRKPELLVSRHQDTDMDVEEAR